MGRTIPEAGVAALLRAIASWGDRATAAKIAGTMSPPIPVRRVRRWLEVLVREHRVVRTGASSGTRYKTVTHAGGTAGLEPGPGGSDGGGLAGADGDAAALRHLLGRPAAQRPSVSFPRGLLDAYCPNETALLPSAVRTRWGETVEMKGVGPGAGAQRDAAARAQIWALVSRSRAVEQRLRLAPRTHGYGPSEAASLTLLGRPDVPQMAGDIRRLWNHQAAFDLLLGQGPAVTLSAETVAAMYDALTCPVAPGRPESNGVGPKTGAPKSRRRPVLLRTAPLVLAETSYRPAADPVVIGGCFRQILGTAGMVTDPLEQAFMLYAQLLLVLPFGAENVSMAVLTANIPLVRAGLKPVTFVGPDATEMVAALAAWWELGRAELLGDAAGA